MEACFLFHCGISGRGERKKSVRFGVRTRLNAEPNALNLNAAFRFKVQRGPEPNARFRFGVQRKTL
jgi:hypothetical protein